MFNCLSVLVLLPLEIATNYLDQVTKIIVEALLKRDITAKEPEMLNAITKPFTNLIIQLDKKVLEEIAKGNTTSDIRILKHNCKKVFSIEFNNTLSLNNSIKEGKCKMKK